MSDKVLLQIDACRNCGSTGRINEQIGLLAKQNGWTSYIAHSARYVNQSKLKSIQIGSKLEEYWHILETKILIIMAYLLLSQLKDLLTRFKK